MASEVDVTRALHAVTATLNDQKLKEFDAPLVQEIVTGTLGGEQLLVAYGSGTSGELRDGTIEGPVVAKFSYQKLEWSGQRVPVARQSDDLQQMEQQRSQQTATKYQKPVRGRIAIWKKKLLGG